MPARTTAPDSAQQPSDRVEHLYGKPEVYDILHAPDTPWEVGGLFRIARRFLGPREPSPMRWLEPACGSGRYLRLAAKQGVRVVGFDREPEMIAYASGKLRESGVSVGRGRAADLFVGDMVGFESRVRARSIDMAFNLINTIRHLPSDRAMLEHLRGIAAVLRPGGVYVVGISLSSYGNEEPDEDVWRGRRGKTEVTQIVSYTPAPGGRAAAARSERVHSHLMVKSRGVVAHHDDTYNLRAYDTKQWRSIIRRSGFGLTATIDEQGEDHTPREPGYCLYVLAPLG